MFVFAIVFVIVFGQLKIIQDRFNCLRCIWLIQLEMSWINRPAPQLNLDKMSSAYPVPTQLARTSIMNAVDCTLHCNWTWIKCFGCIWNLPWTSLNLRKTYYTSCNIAQSQLKGTSYFDQYEKLFPKAFSKHIGFCHFSWFCNNGPKGADIVGISKTSRL